MIARPTTDTRSDSRKAVQGEPFPGTCLSRRLAFTFAFGVVFFAWLVLNHNTPWQRKVVSDLTGLLVSLMGVCWVFSGTLRRGRRFWWADLVGCYLGLYCIGMGCWTYLELVVRLEAPFPCIADAFYIPAQTGLMAGILALPFSRTTRAVRGRALLDGLMVMSACVAFSWYFVLGPNLLAMGATPLAKIVSVAYPLSDLAMFVCLLALASRSPSPALRPGYAALAAGVLGIVSVDSIYGYMTLKGTYASGNLIDVLWPFSQLLMAWGVCSLRAAASAGIEESPVMISERNLVLWRSLLPYALVPPLGALLFYVVRTQGDGKLAAGVYASSAALVGLILLRQVFAMLENSRLYRYLQAAYQEVEAKRHEAAEAAEHLQSLNEELFASYDELARANERLEALATTDGMTGLPNHRTLQERLRQELARGAGGERGVGFLLLDVDRFKAYNDSFGHPAGDEALRNVARLLWENLEGQGVPARYGGEEFAVLLPQATWEETAAVAERVRAAVEGYEFPHRAVTLSIGVSHQFLTGADPEALIASADAALYAAKHGGRNRAVWAGDLTNTVGGSEQAALWQEPDGGLEQFLSEPTGRLVSGLLATLEMRDDETEGHSLRVARFTLRLAREYLTAHPEEVDLRTLTYGAALHDIGKVGIPDAVLFKPGRLTSGEWEIIRQHSEGGARLVAGFDALQGVAPLIRSHHERWDGAGYPDGLAGDQIPLPARLFALADTLDAMSSDRPYRRALPFDKIREEVIRVSGTQFDPRVVEAFLNVSEAEWKRLGMGEGVYLRMPLLLQAA